MIAFMHPVRHGSCRFQIVGRTSATSQADQMSVRGGVGLDVSNRSKGLAKSEADQMSIGGGVGLDVASRSGGSGSSGIIVLDVVSLVSRGSGVDSIPLLSDDFNHAPDYLMWQDNGSQPSQPSRNSTVSPQHSTLTNSNSSTSALQAPTVGYD